jgi:hypothetical protein
MAVVLRGGSENKELPRSTSTPSPTRKRGET